MAGPRRKKQTKLRCPICRKAVELASPLAPFCSERCKLLDLGNWASGRYVIPTPLPDIEESAEPHPGGAPAQAANGEEEG